jgi:hypothetical protein
MLTVALPKGRIVEIEKGKILSFYHKINRVVQNRANG